MFSITLYLPLSSPLSLSPFIPLSLTQGYNSSPMVLNGFCPVQQDTFDKASAYSMIEQLLKVFSVSRHGPGYYHHTHPSHTHTPAGKIRKGSSLSGQLNRTLSYSISRGGLLLNGPFSVVEKKIRFLFKRISYSAWGHFHRAGPMSTDM